MTFTQIITRLKEAYIKAINAIDAESKRNEKALAEHRKHASTYTTKAMEAESEAIKAEHEKNNNGITATLAEEKEALRSEFNKVVKEVHIPTGEAINEKDVDLLNSGIVLTSSEVEEISRKYADNTTMLRIIEAYAKNCGIEVSKETAESFLRAKSSGKVEVEAFEEFEAVADKYINLLLYTSTNADTLEKSKNMIEKYSGIFLEKVIAYEVGAQSNV